MYGKGIVRTWVVALQAFFLAYVREMRRWFWRPKAEPEMRTGDIGGPTRVTPRRGTLPSFVMDIEPERLRCTACGICTQVCPVQCIWIERARTPEGRPRSYPAACYVDVGFCIGCGFCAEFCPFDAIEMSLDRETVSFGRPGPMNAADLASQIF